MSQYFPASGSFTGAFPDADLAPGSVTPSDIAPTGVTPGTYGSAATVGTFTVSNTGQITSASNASISIGSANIIDGSITGTDIAAATITGPNIAAGTIAGSNIAAGAIAGGNIAASTITGGNIAASTITGGNIAASTITGGNIGASTITGSNIAASTITGGNIVDSTITNAKLQNSSVTVGTSTGLTGGGTVGLGGSITLTNTGVTSAAGTAGQINVSAPTGAVTISLPTTGVNAGSYSLANITVDSLGRLTAASNGSAVTSVTAGTGLSGGTITSTGTISLPTTGVGAGSYSLASLTVDSLGRLTAASNAADGSISNAKLANSSLTVNTGTGLSGGGVVSLGGSLSLANTGVTSATGTANQIAVSASTGAVTFSLPQDIATTSSPTFEDLTINGHINTPVCFNTGNISPSLVADNTNGGFNGTVNDPSGFFISAVPNASGMLSKFDVYMSTTNSSVTFTIRNGSAHAGFANPVLATKTVSLPPLSSGIYQIILDTPIAVTAGNPINIRIESSPQNQIYININTTGATAGANMRTFFNISNWIAFLRLYTIPTNELCITDIVGSGGFFNNGYVAITTNTNGAGKIGFDPAGTIGSIGQVLTIDSNLKPVWSTPAAAGVTSVATGTGLSGGPITSSGTISLTNTGVGAGPYTWGNFTVDAQGRLTAASSNTAPVTSVATGAGLSGGPITSTGTISIANGGVTNAMLQNSSITVSAGEGMLGGGVTSLGGTTVLTSMKGGLLNNTTAGGTTALTAASLYEQKFSGTLAEVVTLPDTSTLTVGRSFLISNTSSNRLTVQTFTGKFVVYIPQAGARLISCISTSSNDITSWKYVVMPEVAIPVADGRFYEFAKLVGTSMGVIEIITHPSGDLIFTGYFFGTVTLGTTTLVCTGSDDCYVARMTPNGTYVWAVKFNTTSSASCNGTGLDYDNNGDIYVVAHLANGSCFPAGVASRSSVKRVPMIIKMNSSGTFLWSAQATESGISFSNTYGITTNKTTGESFVAGYVVNGQITFNSAITGTASGTAYIAKINSSGVWQGQAFVAGPQSRAVDVALDSAGNPIMCGMYLGNASTFFGGIGPLTGGSPYNIFVAKYDSSLVPQWVTSGPTADMGSLTDPQTIGVDSLDNIYIGGIYITSIAFPSLPVITTSGSSDYFTAKFNSSGTPQWAVTTIAGIAAETGYYDTIYVTPSGNVYMSIWSHSTQTLTFGSSSIVNPEVSGKHIIAKINSAGVWQWAINSGPTGAATSGLTYGITLDSSGSIYCVCYTNATATWATTPPTTITPSGLNPVLIKLVDSPGIPAIRTTGSATYTMVTTDYSIIFNSASTVTLLPAPTAVGRIIYVKNTAAVAVNSASSDVVPLASTTPGTAILDAVAGKWAMLQSDGTNWIIMMAN